MSLKGLTRRYTRPKRIFRFLLFCFGIWGLYTNYQANFDQIKEKFEKTSLATLITEVSNVLGTKAEQQLKAVLGERVTSQTENNDKNSTSQVQEIINMVQEDLRSFPKRETKKIQHQICEHWLGEDLKTAEEPAVEF